MKRGEGHVGGRPILGMPFAYGLRRSSDGKWQKDGKLLPWFWIGRFPWASTKARGGFAVVIGEWSILVAWGAPNREVEP